jgi:hypothetical protein
MRSLWVLGLLVACNGDKDGAPADTDTGTGEPEPVLAVPYVAWVNAIDQSTNAIKSTCEFGLQLYEGEQMVAEVEGAGNGRQWTGIELEPSVLYTVKARWQDCTSYAEGRGEVTSDVFAGEAGDILVYHYNATSLELDTLVQTEQFESGSVEAVFYEEPEESPADLVAGMASVAVEQVDTKNWRFTWDDTTSPVAVLTALSTTRDYEYGTLVWTDGEAPSWW